MCEYGLKERLQILAIGASAAIAVGSLAYILSSDKVEQANNKGHKAEEKVTHHFRPKVCVEHFGSCHCRQISFKMKAPTVFHAFQVSSKLKFPRITVPCADFELLCDERVLSMYTVSHGEGLLGIHSFCSFCGMHVLYSPTIEPFEIQVNVDCVDLHTVESCTSPRCRPARRSA